MVRNFDVYSDFVGDNTLASYSFDFLITKKEDLKVIILDDKGVLVNEVRGTDTTKQISLLKFDAVEGGGTVTLLANLRTGYQIFLILDPKEPLQNTRIRDKSLFNLRVIEQAFDYVTTALQRLSFQMKRSIKLSDKKILTDTMDMTWPDELVGATAAGKTVIVNATGTGLKAGPAAGEISNAQAYATAAQAAQAAAETAKTNAEAAQLAAENARDAAQAAAGALAPYIRGSDAAPYDIVAGTGIDLTASGFSIDIVCFIRGSGGAVDISANPQITAPQTENDGCKLKLIGCSDTNTVKLENGNGLVLNMSEDTLINNSVREFVRKGGVWVQVSTNNI